MWNNFFFLFFDVNIDIRQDSALLLIFLTLYLSLLFFIFEKQVKSLQILVSFLSFVDNSLFISQEKLVEKTNSFIFL